MNVASVIPYITAQIVAKTGLSAAQVHGISPVDVDPSNFPDILIYRVEDKPHGDGISDMSGGMDRVVTLGITVSMVGTDESETDTLAAQIRAAVLADPTLGGLVQETNWADQKWGIGNLSTPTVLTNLTFNSLYFYYLER